MINLLNCVTNYYLLNSRNRNKFNFQIVDYLQATDSKLQTKSALFPRRFTGLGQWPHKSPLQKVDTARLQEVENKSFLAIAINIYRTCRGNGYRKIPRIKFSPNIG